MSTAIVTADLQGRYESLNVADLESALSGAITAELTAKRKLAQFVKVLHEADIRPEFFTSAKGFKQGDECRKDKALVGVMENVYNAKMLSADDKKLIKLPTKALSEEQIKAKGQIKTDRDNWFKRVARDLARLIGTANYAVNVPKQAPAPQQPAGQVSGSERPAHERADQMVTNIINFFQKQEDARFDITKCVQIAEMLKAEINNLK